MAQASESQRYGINAFPWMTSPFVGSPLVSLLADFNGKLLQSVAGVQNEWADFVNRRVREDVAVSQQLIGCQSFADMHDVNINYVRRAFDQYQEHSQRAGHRAQSTVDELETAQRAPH